MARHREVSSTAIREKKSWPEYLANFITNDLTRALKARGLMVENCPLSPEEFGCLVRLNFEGNIDRKMARSTLEYLLDTHGHLRKT